MSNINLPSGLKQVMFKKKGSSSFTEVQSIYSVNIDNSGGNRLNQFIWGKPVSLSSVGDYNDFTITFDRISSRTYGATIGNGLSSSTPLYYGDVVVFHLTTTNSQTKIFNKIAINGSVIFSRALERQSSYTSGQYTITGNYSIEVSVLNAVTFQINNSSYVTCTLVKCNDLTEVVGSPFYAFPGDTVT